jgi:carbamoyl-phosphate synthase large subunit
MDKTSIRILIEAAGTATCLSVLTGLQEQKRHAYHSVVVDMDPQSAGRYAADEFHIVPSSKDPCYADRILELCTRHRINLFVPIMDYGFSALAARKNDFIRAGCLPLIADPSSIAVCMDKYNTHRFFCENNIRSPQTFISKNSAVPFPCIIKPRTGGVASKGVFLARNKQDLEFYTQEPNFVIQECIFGKEFTADCLSSLDGEVFIAAVIRERVSTKGGVSIKSKVVSPDETRRITPSLKVIAQTLRLPGAYNIQGFITPDEDICFIEINPRFAGTHTFSIRAGLNSIACILDLIKKEKTPELLQAGIQINNSLEMIRYWNEIFVENGAASTWMHPFLKQH